MEPGNTSNNNKILAFLFDRITPHKRALFIEKIQHRTQHFQLVLDNLKDPHNISAIYRSADIFGFQTVHSITQEEPPLQKSISKNTEKWLFTPQYTGTHGAATCFETLQKQGFKIMGLSTHPEAIPLEKLELNAPLAFVLGNEKYGLQAASLPYLDGYVSIPMVGFAESLNVSVAAGILMHHLRAQHHHTERSVWQLTKEQEMATLIAWAERTLPHGTALVQHFLEKGA
jgi:tRNA (guanosine-2'-O-)-methyltransferase